MVQKGAKTFLTSPQNGRNDDAKTFPTSPQNGRNDDEEPRFADEELGRPRAESAALPEIGFSDAELEELSAPPDRTRDDPVFEREPPHRFPHHVIHAMRRLVEEIDQRVSCVLHSLESERSWFGIKTWFWMVPRTAIVQRRYSLCFDEKLTQLP